MGNPVLADGSPGLMGQIEAYQEVAAAGTLNVSPEQNNVRIICLGQAAVNLPALADVGDGFELWVVGEIAAGGGDEVTITPDGTEQINAGGAGVALVLTTSNFESVRIVKSTTQWVAGVA